MSKKVFEPKHYWICSQCAKDNGGVWPEGHVCTVMKDICPYCKVETTVIPWVDFNWPNAKTLTKRAQAMRD